ncbi:MAG: PQQ-binding-like beta-propeller repeat protein [Planctomycetales bacterium]|nr:PQQ-binding-like beta-propeller repeat protein [Planctomycetales bacterium]
MINRCPQVLRDRASGRLRGVATVASYLMFLISLLGSAVAHAEPAWSAFRGDQAMGSTDRADLPWQWSESQNIRWKAKMPGAGASSPCVWGEQILLTCYTGYFVPGEQGGSLDDLKRHLLAFDRNDGKQLWQYTVPAKLPEEEQIRDHGFAANTAAADAERIYVHFGKSGVHAVDHQGKRVWQADVGSQTSGWGTSASPVLYKDLVLINASVESESLVALDRDTGKERWRVGGIREAWNTPLIVKSSAGRDELIVAIHGKVLAFAPDTGKALWNCDTDISWYMVPTAVARDGVVYFLGGRSGTASLAVRCGGSGDVTDTHRIWTSNKGSNVSSPVLYGPHLYWMNDQRGIAYCADAKSGDVLYEQRLERADQVYASALRAGERIYYLARNGTTFVVAANPTFKQLSVNHLSDGGQFNASPAVDGNHLLIRSDKFLYCIGD